MGEMASPRKDASPEDFQWSQGRQANENAGQPLRVAKGTAAARMAGEQSASVGGPIKWNVLHVFWTDSGSGKHHRHDLDKVPHLSQEESVLRMSPEVFCSVVKETTEYPSETYFWEENVQLKGLLRRPHNHGIALEPDRLVFWLQPVEPEALNCTQGVIELEFFGLHSMCRYSIKCRVPMTVPQSHSCLTVAPTFLMFACSLPCLLDICCPFPPSTYL